MVPTVPAGGLLELTVGGCVAVTLIELVPFTEAAVASVAVRLCVPAVSNVAARTFEVPTVSVAFAGRFACASLLVKCTVPE